MSFRKLLISLSLLALMALPALAQDQTSQTPNAQPQASQPQASRRNRTATNNRQTRTAEHAAGHAGSTTSSTTSSTPTPPQDPRQAQFGSDSARGPSSILLRAADSRQRLRPAGPPPIQEPDDSKVKHDGKEDDVDAIGNRKIGGRGLGDWYSLETEIRMGKQYAMQVEQSVKLVQDPVVNEYVNRIGQNLVRNSDAQVPFTIKVIDSDEVNAFALPGGFFYVNSGLILAADEEAELAGVMAHEISHVCARHGMRQMTRANWAQIGTLPLIFIGGGIGYGIYEASGLALPLTFMKFQRNFEAEADYLGLQYMYKTGYDPQAFISFFEKIQAKEKKKPGTHRQGLRFAPADARPH